MEYQNSKIARASLTSPSPSTIAQTCLFLDFLTACKTDMVSDDVSIAASINTYQTTVGLLKLRHVQKVLNKKEYKKHPYVIQDCSNYAIGKDVKGILYETLLVDFEGCIDHDQRQKKSENSLLKLLVK